MPRATTFRNDAVALGLAGSTTVIRRVVKLDKSSELGVRPS